MTHALPKDSVNITSNWPCPVARIVGRYAFSNGKTRSELIREAVEEKIARDCPSVAAQIAEEKAKRRVELIRAGYAVCLLCVGLIFAGQQLTPEKQTCQRTGAYRVWRAREEV